MSESKASDSAASPAVSVEPPQLVIQMELNKSVCGEKTGKQVKSAARDAVIAIGKIDEIIVKQDDSNFQLSFF